MLSEAMEAAPVSPAGLGLGGNAPHSPTRLQTAVASAFAQPLASRRRQTALVRRSLDKTSRSNHSFVSSSLPNRLSNGS